ncbi:hypothetical protein FACS1894199_15900 [Bacteroidia bacterium]|nr:hypothetical protein FACS1894199_15900 [Bacteroidia bacterium]
MFDELKRYKNKGHFFFQKGDSLSEQSKDVPDAPGVYYIVRLSRGKVDIVYIGNSGTMQQNGKFKEQLLRERLNNKQEEIKCEDFFNEKLVKENIDGLDIYWFVTFDEDTQDLPDYVEGLLLQRYFSTYRKLPAWNKE